MLDFRRHLSVAVLSLFSASASAADWNAVAQKVQNAVVIVSSNASIAFNGEFPETLVGTGTVIDKKLGLVLTNAHVTSSGPVENMKIQFLDYQTTPAKVLYVDPWHDFAFVQFDPTQVSETDEFSLADVPIGRHASLKKKQELLLIGNSSGEGIAYKVGTIDNLLLNRAPNPLGRHSHHLKLTLARAGGASGSPLFDESGTLVALHDSGSPSGSESFELCVDYVSDAYDKIRGGSLPVRGDLGVSLSLITYDTAKMNYQFPGEKPGDQMILIEKVIPGVAASAALAPGDLILAAKEAGANGFFSLGSSLYAFDRLVDRSAGKQIVLRVYRQSASPHTFEVTLPVVTVSNAVIPRYIRFANAHFQDISPFLALKFDIPMRGVFMVSAAYGTSLDELGFSVDNGGRSTENKFVLIKEINRRPTNSLDDLRSIVGTLPPNARVTITSCDYNAWSKSARCRPIDLEISEDSFAEYVWDSTLLKHRRVQ